MDDQSQTPQEPSTEVKADAAPDTGNERRRQALVRMGLFAAFTAPLLLGMLKAEKAMASS